MTSLQVTLWIVGEAIAVLGALLIIVAVQWGTRTKDRWVSASYRIVYPLQAVVLGTGLMAAVIAWVEWRWYGLAAIAMMAVLFQGHRYVFIVGLLAALTGQWFLAFAQLLVLGVLAGYGASWYRTFRSDPYLNLLDRIDYPYPRPK
jgi:hypothetical protein